MGYTKRPAEAQAGRKSDEKDDESKGFTLRHDVIPRSAADEGRGADFERRARPLSV
jgi:hypothetical protein